MTIVAMSEMVQMIDVSTNMSPIVCPNPDISEHAVIYFTRWGRAPERERHFYKSERRGKIFLYHNF